MPHLHGFTKTLRYNLLMPADVEKQAFCTTMLYRQVVSYYLQVFQEHQEIISHDKWLDSKPHSAEDVYREILRLPESYSEDLPGNGRASMLPIWWYSGSGTNPLVACAR